MSQSAGSARERAFRFIGLDRRKSSGRVRSALLRAGYSTETVEQTIEALVAENWIDDVAAAERILSRHQGKRIKSRRALRHILIQNGVARAVAESTVQALPPDDLTAQRWLELTCPDPTAGEPERLMRQLVSRGYAATLAVALISRYVQNGATD